MNNFEFYKDEISKMAKEREKRIAIVNGKPTECDWNVECINCDRYDNCNDGGLVKWFLSEHVEETNNAKVCKNLKVDDKILVSYAGSTWFKRHFAGYDSENDYVLTFDSGTTSWTADEKHNIAHWKYAKLPKETGEQNV